MAKKKRTVRKKLKPKKFFLKSIILSLLVLILLVGVVPLFKLGPGAHPNLIEFVDAMTNIRDHLAQFYGLYAVLITLASALAVYLKKIGGNKK